MSKPSKAVRDVTKRFHEGRRADKLMRSIGVYVDIWRDGDDAWHSIGHIKQLLAEYERAVTPSPTGEGEK
jgi:hypothetical protein